MTLKNYIRVEWIHSNDDEPFLYHLELDEERMEIRRVQKYRDGRLIAIDAQHESEDEFLAWDPVPPNEKLATDPEFEIEVITKETFEAIWTVATKYWE